MTSAHLRALDDLAERHPSFTRDEIDSVLSDALGTAQRSVGRVDLVLAMDLADLRLTIRSQHRL